MTKETFMAILKEESMIFTEKELMEMIDEELAKYPDEMDTDFIDLCLNALDGKYDDEEIERLNQQAPPSGKRFKLGRLLIVAAIIVVILAASVPVCAKYLNLNVAEGVVEVTEDCFNVDLNASAESINVITKLEDENLVPVIPNELLKSEYVFENYQSDERNTACKTYFVDFKNDEIKGSLTISVYDDNYNFASGRNFANKEYETFKQITKENKEILVFGDKESSSIYYLVDNTEYVIFIDSDFTVAYNIAETL